MKTSEQTKMKTTIESVTVNEEQKLFVIPCNGGYSCLGFQVLEDRLIRLGSELTNYGYIAPMPAFFGTLERYKQYEAVLAFGRELNRTTGWRSKVELTRELIGLEGKRVEITDDFGTRRFIVGKSTGWMPCHLEIKQRNSSGGFATCCKNVQRVRVVYPQ